MGISLFDLFTVGIGPSSSHTVGPMLAALDFVSYLEEKQQLSSVKRVIVNLYGSLALTGKGHGTDKAILNGLNGKHPATVDPNTMQSNLEHIISTKKLKLNNQQKISFIIEKDLNFLQKEFLAAHSNGMRFYAYDKKKKLLHDQIYYSIGGGFICKENELPQSTNKTKELYPFQSAKELLKHCQTQQLTISEIVFANEKTWRKDKEITTGILQLIDTMFECIDIGTHTSGELPGGLHVKRRAPGLHKKLTNKQGFASAFESIDIMNRLNLYAMAVNEENAAGGRIVTAPTNGAAGIIPAVLKHYQEAYPDSNQQGLIDFFLTATAIGILYKKGASISGAEVGCQGEVGVASSMAAAGLTAALGGDYNQVENAAEIAMEHHLGMTCDPIAGLVQIPCIERNAMGAVKAVNAARMALIGDGEHHVPLDKVIRTMLETGKDMKKSYKETSLGGLAVNHPEC